MTPVWQTGHWPRGMKPPPSDRFRNGCESADRSLRWVARMARTTLAISVWITTCIVAILSESKRRNPPPSGVRMVTARRRIAPARRPAFPRNRSGVGVDLVGTNATSAWSSEARWTLSVLDCPERRNLRKLPQYGMRLPSGCIARLPPAEVSEVDRVVQLVAENADNASSLRKMFVVNEVRVKNIRKEFPKREREVIREAVTLNQEKVDELCVKTRRTVTPRRTGFIVLISLRKLG